MNYNRGLIKQIEDLTYENEKFKECNTKLRAEKRELKKTIESLEKRIDAFDAKIEAAIEKTVAPLKAELVKKDNEILRLKSIINKDSSNSSKPPSSNGFKKVFNSREKSGRPKGGQKGHVGHRCHLPENLEELVKSGKAEKYTLDYTEGAKDYVSKWKIDVVIKPVYTEYRYPVGTKLPPELQPFVTYGNTTKSLAVIMSVEEFVAEKRISEFFDIVTDGLVRPSVGSVNRFIKELGKNIPDEMIENLRNDLLNGKVMNVDETPMRCTETLVYDAEGKVEAINTAEKSTHGVITRTHSNSSTTLYTVNPRKDDEGVLRDQIINQFQGILSHDHDKKYYKYGTGHATCGAHLLRDLKGLSELYNCLWAKQFATFVVEMNEHKKSDIKSGIKICRADVLEDYSKRYDQFMAKGTEALAKMDSKEFGYNELRKMVNRLIEYKEAYLLFMHDYDAPFTNNLSERDLRPCKTKQKISGCFRTWDGLLCYAKTKSVLSTARKRCENLFDTVRGIFDDCEPRLSLTKLSF